jgi:glucose-1-phosphate thymidylyltransferase
LKALVLAGGHGTRLRPLTHTSAKQLIPVANKPVMFYGLESILEAGVTDVGIVVGDTADEVQAAVGDGSQMGLNVTYITQDQPLGLAHCVLIARDFLADDDFVMFLGDNFLIGGIRDFVSDFSESSFAARILLTEVPNPEHFGVAELATDGTVVRLVEKSPDPPSNLALVGVYMFRPSIHQAVRSIKPSGRGELEITDAIQWLIDEGKPIDARPVTGYWKDTGRLEDMLECNRKVLENLAHSIDGQVDSATQIIGKVVIEPGAVVANSHIRGPAIIGSKTIVRNSYIGPFTSVYHSCVIEDSEVEHSIILEGVQIVGVSRIEDSLIGKDVEVRRSQHPPLAYRLMVGDHSQVLLP